MRTNGPRDIEKNLLSLSPKTIPPGLRTRVLESAQKKRQGLLIMPWMWASAAACAALMAVAVIGDAAFTKLQNDDLRELLNGPGISLLTGDDYGPLAAEIDPEVSELEKAGLERMVMARPAIIRMSLQDVFEARERLKGWLDHENEGPESPD